MKNAGLCYVLYAVTKLVAMKFINETNALNLAGVLKIWYIKNNGYQIDTFLQNSNIGQYALEIGSFGKDVLLWVVGAV